MLRLKNETLIKFALTMLWVNVSHEFATPRILDVSLIWHTQFQSANELNQVLNNGYI